jgi:hypothetical protein
VNELPNFNAIPDSMKVRSILDLPVDEVQTDPLRQLANHWRTMGATMASDGTSEGFAAAGVAYELADQLTAILNSVARRSWYSDNDAKPV